MPGRKGGMSTDLDDRVRALERAVTARDDPPEPLPDVADVSATAADLEDRVGHLESRVQDLAARQQAVEAYVDRVEHVNESIERRADAALAAVDRLESARESDLPAEPSTEPAGSREYPESPSKMGSDAERSQARSVPDAASTGASSDERPDSTADGLIARLVGL